MTICDVIIIVWRRYCSHHNMENPCKNRKSNISKGKVRKWVFSYSNSGFRTFPFEIHTGRSRWLPRKPLQFSWPFLRSVFHRIIAEIHFNFPNKNHFNFMPNSQRSVFHFHQKTFRWKDPFNFSIGENHFNFL